MPGSWSWAAAGAAALLALLPGCLDPYVAHADPAAVDALDLDWVRQDIGSASEGTFGARTAEVDYVHDPDGSSAPYPGFVQVFSVREPARRSTEELLRLVQDAVDAAARAKSIAIDADATQRGERTLRNGLATTYFTQEGTVTTGGLFAQDTVVRILGEVGHDGKSSTTVVAVGIAQTRVDIPCPIVGGTCDSREDLRTWIEIAGDLTGSVQGATDTDALVWNLVTHG